MRFPILIDFTAYLAVVDQVDVPNVSITVHSTEWIYVNDPDGKPAYEIADRVTFRLGDNETDSQTTFAHMLANYSAQQRDQLWFYNQASFAIQRRMLPHVHAFDRVRRRRKAA